MARVVQGLGAVSGPVTAFLADLTRPESRTRAMFAIGMSIGATFVVSLVAGPLLAAAIGVSGVFWLIGALGVRRARARRASRCRRSGPLRSGRDARRLARGADADAAPHYAGIFVLHLTLTAAFIAVPHVLRDLHGLDASRHWLVYLGVFAASVALTVPLVLWSERNRSLGRAACVGGARPRRAFAALVLAKAHFGALLGRAGALFRRLQLPRSPAAGGPDRGGGGGDPRRGPRRVRDLPVRGGVCGRPRGRQACSEAIGRSREFLPSRRSSPSPGCRGAGDGIAANRRI